MNDEKYDLILKAINNDKNALEKLIKKEQNSIYATLLYLKKDENELNDILQDVLLKIVRKIHQLKNPINFKTWLNQIIINSYYDYLRKNKNKIVEYDINEISNKEAIEFKFNPQKKILSNELDNLIKKSIQNLPSHYKIPITLREIQGLSYQEISNLTKSTVGTVKSRIARARGMIKDEVNRYLK